jgi:hypothetical protein
MRTICLSALSLMCCAFVTTFAQAPLPTQRVRGEIVALDGLNLQVKSRTGEALTIKLAENYAVTSVVRLDPGAIKTGTFVGAAAMPQADGTETALEVLVFPDAMRGSSEGHYPWDLKPGSMMTNATVADTVMEKAGARRMTLKYKDGENIVVVPADAPVVTFEPGERTQIVPGAHIIVTATKQPDGTLTASRVAVGKDGLVPPM